MNKLFTDSGPSDLLGKESKGPDDERMSGGRCSATNLKIRGCFYDEQSARPLNYKTKTHV